MPLTVFAKRRMADLELTGLHLVSRLPFHRLRLRALRVCGATIGRGVVVYHGFEVRAARRLSIGDRASIGNDVILDARGHLSIGADVNISTGVNIWTAQHDWRAANFDYVQAPVVIEDHAWISNRATILPGVTIGQGVVVAAGAVVSKSVPAGAVVAGVPAKVVAQRDTMTYQLGGPRQKPWWW